MNQKIDWVKVREEAHCRILRSEKCFCCGNKAVVVANTCSPTSASGMTPPRPWCAYCLLSMRGGVNIFEWRVPIGEARKALEDAMTFATDRIKHGVNIIHNEAVRIRGHKLLKEM